MTELDQILLFTVIAGACIPIGGLIASIERIHPGWMENELRHAVIAFGGGILLAAVALVLVPDGVEYVDHGMLSTVIFLCGGLCFFALEKRLAARRRQQPQLMAMLLDFIPESMALGGVFALGSPAAPLLALFIGLQNLPEGFNAYRELLSVRSNSRKKILLTMTAMIFLGPTFALIGYFYFSQNTVLLGAVMLFASGGILYLIFQDIAPQSKMQRHWTPPLGAVLGFSIGMLGNTLIAGH